eukprot:TRINITY_DN12_c0_g2_i1.p1 TRINITY_DN12_c0_g2~~TRINITY_DN12_c0_g2_i1.p1  ORF type:complete len:452 (+),score=211.16 TRINITY_DN12_c0_g2_i1:55-1410(+)
MPEMEGWLKKAGGGMMKRDKDRWFELRGKRLFYYECKPMAGEKPLGVILLQDTTVTEDPKKKFAWTISGPNMPKPYTLYAGDAKEKAAWIGKIQGASSGIVDDDDGHASPTGDDDEDDMFDSEQIGVDDFDPLCVVGKGSFGKVMQVRKKDTGKIYAMKCMSKDLILREGLVEHMKAEKNILGMIDHPFIVKLHYAFQTKDSLYLILDFLSGGELFYHLSQVSSVFPERQAKFYAAQIGSALGHLHSLNIIYRDLKPENCVLDREGNCCITDFGLAKPNITGAEGASTFCGTPEYLAPEFLTGGGHGKAVDWWSLGILLYEMMTGLPPFYSENIKEMYDLILRKKLTFPDHMPTYARDLCSKLLDRTPADRMQKVEQFMNHPFFNDIDFAALVERKLPVPFKPDQSAQNFDSEFTDLQARHSVAVMTQADKGEFDEFHFDRKAHRAKMQKK